MYTQSCYIKLNTKELRDALRNMGYTCGFIKDTNKDPNKAKYIQCVNEAINGKAVDFYENPNKGINCETNKELFLALAALQDDNDKNQWFVADTPNVIEDYALWFKCPYLSIKDVKFSAYMNAGYTYHKATVEEIIEHFKK